jgi:ADP-L-glycero-D-manno-heptose 6-epimerase
MQSHLIRIGGIATCSRGIALRLAALAARPAFRHNSGGPGTRLVGGPALHGEATDMIVITGGAGFIGSNLAAALEARGGESLVVVDRLGTDDKWRNLGKRELLAIVPPEELFDYLDKQRGDIEAVFHMGAISSTTEPDADLVIRTNLTLSQKLWSWCAESRARLIYASSAATYGDGTAGFEDDWSSAALARLVPLNSYGWSKHLFDRWVARQIERGYPAPPQWAGLKFFNVYGPNEYHKGGQQSVVAHIANRVMAGGHATLFRSHHPDYADGGQLRDFVSVDDVVAVMMWLYGTPGVSGIFNVGTGKARSFLDLATAVFDALGKAPDIRYVDTPEKIRANYQYFTEARMDRLRAAGCRVEPTGLEQGVTAYVQSFLMQADRYR